MGGSCSWAGRSEPTGPRAVAAALRLRIIPPKIGNPPDVQAGQAEVS
jgi:hypothetical protein